MNKKQRNKNRATSLELMYKLPPKYECPNCKEKTHFDHFVPPTFIVKEGFWGCYL